MKLLELGVFDELAKPLCLEEMLARAPLRGRDSEAQRVIVDERKTVLSKTEYKFLRVCEHAGIVLSHEALFARV